MPYRIDVVFDGALDGTEYYEDDQDLDLHLVVDFVAMNILCDDNNNTAEWQVSLYDEAPYPPELVYERNNYDSE